MKEKGERGNRGGGLMKKEKRQGVLGKMPFFLPGSSPEQRWGRAERVAGRSGVPADGPCAAASGG
jgi:hypothetical protein